VDVKISFVHIIGCQVFTVSWELEIFNRKLKSWHCKKSLKPVKGVNNLSFKTVKASFLLANAKDLELVFNCLNCN